MRKTYFPRARFIRQLSSMYDEIGQYREVLGREGTEGWWNAPSWRLDERLRELESVQHDLHGLILSLRGLTDLS
jgi:hypothetical protein